MKKIKTVTVFGREGCGGSSLDWEGTWENFLGDSNILDLDKGLVINVKSHWRSKLTNDLLILLFESFT